MSTVAIVQARLGSTRLPNKVLMPLAGRPAILQMLDRVSQATTLDAIWLATGDDAGNDPLAQAVEEAGYPVFRGSESDVLDRFARLAEEAAAETVVRLTGDCPLHDPEVIDEVVAAFQMQTTCHYGSNIFPATFPDGLDCEVFTAKVLLETAATSRNPMEREHVTLGIHRQYHEGGTPEIVNVEAPADFSHLRWTLDTPEDAAFITAVFDALYPQSPAFSWFDVLALLTREPHLLTLNSQHLRNEGVMQKISEGGLLPQG